MAEHDIEKIVEAGGEVFNFRDPTKQPVADRVTSWSSTPSGTKYPSEKLVKDSLDKKIPFDHKLLDTNPFGGDHLYINYLRNAMFLMNKRYYVTATIHEKTDGSIEYPRVKPGAVETDDEYYEDGPVVSTCTAAEVARLFNGNYDNNGISIPAGKYVKIHIRFSNAENWKPSTSTAYAKGYPYGRYYLSFYYTRVPLSAEWRCYNKYSSQGVGWKHGDFSYYKGNANAISDVILEGSDTGNYLRSCIEFIVQAKDSLDANITQVDWALSRPDFSIHIPFFSNFCDQTSFVNWRFKQNDFGRTNPVIEIIVDTGTIKSQNLQLSNALGVQYGGTGKTSVTAGNYVVGAGTSALVEKTPKEVGSNILASLDNKSNASSYADFVDGDFVVGSDHVNESTISASTFVRRTALNLWNYIKGKISSVLGLTASSYGGTAAVANAYDATFSGSNSIASKFGEKQNLLAWDAAADTYNASTNRAATVDSIVRRVSVKADDISFTEGSESAATVMTSKLLCGIQYSSASLGSTRLSFCMYLTINRGNARKGGVLCGTIDSSGTGYLYVNELCLTAQFGGLSVSDFVLLQGKIDGKAAIGVAWTGPSGDSGVADGTLGAGRYIDARILDYKVVGGTFVYDVAVTDSSTASWAHALQNATDSDVVHKAGTETITGEKEFRRSGQDISFTDSDGYESIVRARTSTSNNNGSCQLDADASDADSAKHKFGVYGRTESTGTGTGKWIAFIDNNAVVNLGQSGDEVRIGGTKFVFGASQLGTDSNTFYWV